MHLFGMLGWLHGVDVLSNSESTLRVNVLDRFEPPAYTGSANDSRAQGVCCVVAWCVWGELTCHYPHSHLVHRNGQFISVMETLGTSSMCLCEHGECSRNTGVTPRSYVHTDIVPLVSHVHRARSWCLHSVTNGKLQG